LKQTNCLYTFLDKKMNGEKINILGRTYIHYEKRIKLPDFQPRIADLRATHRRNWYKFEYFK
jgi:hypothetical protein